MCKGKLFLEDVREESEDATRTEDPTRRKEIIYIAPPRKGLLETPGLRLHILLVAALVLDGMMLFDAQDQAYRYERHDITNR